MSSPRRVRPFATYSQNPAPADRRRRPLRHDAAKNGTVRWRRSQDALQPFARPNFVKTTHLVPPQLNRVLVVREQNFKLPRYLCEIRWVFFGMEKGVCFSPCSIRAKLPAVKGTRGGLYKLEEKVWDENVQLIRNRIGRVGVKVSDGGELKNSPLFT